MQHEGSEASFGLVVELSVVEGEKMEQFSGVVVENS